MHLVTCGQVCKWVGEIGTKREMYKFSAPTLTFEQVKFEFVFWDFQWRSKLNSIGETQKNLSKNTQ